MGDIYQHKFVQVYLYHQSDAQNAPGNAPSSNSFKNTSNNIGQDRYKRLNFNLLRKPDTSSFHSSKLTKLDSAESRKNSNFLFIHY